MSRPLWVLVYKYARNTPPAHYRKEGRSSEMISTCLSLVLLVFTPIVCILRRRARPKHQYPPGPSGLPILGNLPAILRGNWYETFTEWQGQYGK